MKKLKVSLPQQPYPIYLKKGLLEEIPNRFKEKYPSKRLALITDENVEKLYGRKLEEELKSNGFKTQLISIPPGEQSKSIRTLEEIYEKLLDFQITRGDILLTLGGGVVGDVGGMAAATYLRGIPLIHIPTSLLAQIDSSIGGKVAINLPRGKNLIGSFYHPQEVYIDPQLLTTLDKRYFRDGLAEIIKYGCIKDKELFHQLLAFPNEEQLFQNIEDIIYTCCKIKSHIVEKDEKDAEERMLLNFGHTLGHAIEKYFHYEKFTHGEAVALGMYNITKKSEEQCITQKGTAEGIKQLLKKYHLPHQMPKIDREDLIKTIGLDKKNRGQYINIVLLEKLGNGFIQKFSPEEIERMVFIEKD